MNASTRIRIANIENEYEHSSIPFCSVTMEKLLTPLLGINCIKRADINYKKDPFNIQNKYTQYVFMDFVWTTNENVELKNKLMETGYLELDIAGQIIQIYIQDKSQNLLLDSVNSYTYIYGPSELELIESLPNNSTQEEYNSVMEKIKDQKSFKGISKNDLYDSDNNMPPIKTYYRDEYIQYI